MVNHINNRDLCYEGKHTFDNVAHNFEVSEDTYQELRGKNMEKIKLYHDEVMKELEKSITDYKANTRGGDEYILNNKIRPTVTHLNSINLKIINMLEETMNSMEDIEFGMADTKEQKAKFETKLNDINLEIERVEKRIEDMSQNLQNNSKVTQKLSDENKVIFIVNCVILGIVLIGCLYIIFRPNKLKAQKLTSKSSSLLFGRKNNQLESRGPTLTKEEKEGRNKVLSKLLDQNNKNTKIKGAQEEKLSRREKRELRKLEEAKAEKDKPIPKKKGIFDFLKRKKKETPEKVASAQQLNTQQV